MDVFYEKQQSYLKRINNSFINFKKDGVAKMNRGSCKVRIENIDSYWRKITEAHEHMLESEQFDRNHEYYNGEFIDRAEEIYLQRKGEFEEFLINVVSGASTSAMNADNQVSRFQSNQLVRLPIPELPKFSGDFRSWETFRDLMKSMVVDRNDISDVAKMQYLQSCLSGEASDLIRTIPITGENFPLAWQSLKNYYENTRRLTSAHLATLLDLNPMRNESAAELRRIYAGTINPLLALEALQRPVDQWDDIIVFITERRFDQQTRRAWELKVEDSTVPPTYEMLKNFLKTKIMSLDSIESSRPWSRSLSQSPGSPNRMAQRRKQFREDSGTSRSRNFHVRGRSTDRAPLCIMCNQAHWLAFCEAFKSKSIEQRKEFVKNKNLCYNCLGNHVLNNCISKKRCQICHRKHHTLIHSTNASETNKDRDIRNSETEKKCTTFSEDSTSANVHLTHSIRNRPDDVLLPTAWVKVISHHGEVKLARALIDQCAQSSFITESLCQRLKLHKKSISVNVSGLGGRHHMACRGATSITIKPRFSSSFSCQTDVLVVPRVTSYKPRHADSNNDWCHLMELVLADPNFQQAGPIDMLLGAAVHARVVEGRVIKGRWNHPIATATALGWIISGETNANFSQCSSSLTIQHISAEMSLESLLQRFWQQEEVNVKVCSLTPDEQTCENHFVSNYSRSPDGRYVVRLPVISEKLKNLGDTYNQSVNMLFRMEKKFKWDIEFKNSYCEFMQEYLNLGHMESISESEVNLNKYIFLPHHGVLKASSTTTKLRTVFNGSLKTNHGLSLNDCLLAGPNLLPDLVSLVTSWRKYRYAFTADIKMMYRQIIVHEADRHLQTIAWRYDPSHKIKFYTLRTLTYGLKCSPFIANRVIKQLAGDEALNFPLGSIILNDETYMDDVLSGCNDVQTALAKQREVINLCKVGGFSLRKWLSNDSALLDWLPNDLLAIEPETLFEDESAFAVLGLTWQPNEDYFKFSVKIEPHSEPWTKRKVLSAAAKLFDPLGWLAPIVIVAKIFMQKLWILKMDWDDQLPHSEAEQWQTYYRELSQISSIKIPRWLGYSKSLSVLQLHGFADASKLGYAAVLYLRSGEEESESTVNVKLIQAKTKVAPLKTLSIPRLELCAVHLLSKLTNQHLKTLGLESPEIHLWTDSQDVLYWLKEHPSRWPTFVANRCSDIHTLVPNAKWHHVGTKFNPADLASRGCSPSALINRKLWWSGPDWLSKPEIFWPKPFHYLPKKLSSSECKINLTVSLTNTMVDKSDRFNIVQKYSNLKTLQHVMAYIIRFLIAKRVNHPVFSEKWFGIEARYSELILTPSEINRSRLLLVYIVQRQSFQKEISQLEKTGLLSKGSVLVKLSPFVHQKLLRVGGRIKHSLLSEDEKHPLILPSNHPFTKLVIEDCHKCTLHGGVQLTLTTLRMQYWIVKGRQMVKKIIHGCVTCQRYRASATYQIMGNLPAHRTVPSRPFSKSGVDYAGPVAIRTSPGRGHASYKGFICIFVCLSTRAVHIEAVSNYTAEAFIAAFRRFVGRRGHCSLMLSDRGTNFVGADQELRRMFQRSSNFTNTIAGTLASSGTEWRFNPPAAPHFGGIWEAAVKSAKHHIRRVIGETKLTFEELSTLLCQVEACLNSRPLIPLSDDPTDNQALTPAHFLIHSASYIIPEPYLIEENIPILKRWQLVQQMLQNIWGRWSKEYLQSLQQRHKWTEQKSNLKVGDLVILRSENTAPAQWPLARVITVYPGDDGLVRVVKIKFNNSVMKRPVTKLIMLRNVSSQST